MRQRVTSLFLFAALILVPVSAVAGEAFSQGTWTAQVTGSVLDDVSSHSDITYMLSVGAGHFFLPGFSVNVEVQGLVVTQDGDDASGVGLALVPRWHFYRDSDWSVYLDGGFGMIVTNEDVPPGAKKQNFQEFIGLGLTRLVGEELMFMAGMRYRHISNAHSSDNPGLDNIEGYVGLMIPF